MHRRRLLTLPLLAVLPVPAALTTSWAASALPSELRAGLDPALAARMGRRLGVPVRSVRHGLVAALDAGHLEVALLDRPELAAARRRMGERLVPLPGRFGTRTAVTRRVLSPELRQDLARALA